MPRQFLLETINLDSSDVNDETIAPIRGTNDKVISVGLLPIKANKDNKQRNIQVALLSVKDDASDAEIKAISDAVEKTGLGIFKAAPKQQKEKEKEGEQQQQASNTNTNNKKRGNKVPLTQTAFTAKPTTPASPARAASARGGRGAAAGATTSSRGGRGGAASGDQQQQSGRGGRGGRGGARSVSRGRGGGRGGRGNSRGGRGRGNNNEGGVPVHMQALMRLPPPTELMYRGAPNPQAAAMFFNQMMQQQMMNAMMAPPPLQQQHNANPYQAQQPSRMWPADVHAVFMANVAPPVTNKQLSLSAGEEIVVVHIERGEDIAIMYVATEQQARATVMKLNGSKLHGHTLNVSYGGRKVIPLPYPPTHQGDQQQQQNHNNNNKQNNNNNKQQNNNKKQQQQKEKESSTSSAPAAAASGAAVASSTEKKAEASS